MNNVTLGTFPERLDVCLKKQGWTKTELARQLKISHPAVLKWYPPKNALPRSETMFLMATLFGVNPAWLSDGRGAMISPQFMSKEEIAAMEAQTGSSSAEGLAEPQAAYGTNWEAEARRLQRELDQLKQGIATLIKPNNS